MFGRLTDWSRLALRDDRCAHTVVSAMCLAATGILGLSFTRPDPRHDPLRDGRFYRRLNVFDDCNRQGLGTEVALSLPAARVMRG